MLVITLMLVGYGVLLWQSHLIRAQMQRLNGVSDELIEVLRVHADLLSFYERLHVSARAEDSARLLKESEKLRAILLEDAQRTRSAFRHLPAEVKADPTVLPTLESIDATLLSHLNAIAMLTESGEWEAVRIRLDKYIQPLESLSSQLVNSIAQEVGTQRALASFNIERAQRRVLFIVPLTGCLTLLMAALSGWAITRSITEPLRRLVEGSSALARGEFQYKVLVVGHDELAQVGKVFNLTAERLQSLYETLRRRETYLAEAQRLSQTGSWAWNPATGENTYGSEECLRVLGFDPAGPLPRFEEFFERIHPDDQAASRERFEKAIRDKADFEFGYRIVHPDKGVRDIHVVGHSVLDGSGGLREFVGTVIDITERKRAEQELQQLVDFVPQVIVVLGPDGKWMYANRVAREYTGLTLDEYRSVDVIGRVIHPDDAEKMRAVRQRRLSGNDPFELEARLLGKDGVYRWFLFRYNPLLEQARVRRWYASATEIESRKQKEYLVRKENVRLEERTRIAQELHDTLLQSFLGASMQLGVVLQGVPSDLPAKACLDRILQLMQDGIEQGRKALQGLRSPDPGPSDLAVALSGVQQEVAVQPGIDFRVTVAGSRRPLQPPVQHEIYRIGKEALVNAFRHSGAKSIQVELDYSDRDLRMRIRDNGCGIDPHVIHAGREGHWGLAGMRERATRIGGLLKISSSATGTEIEFSLPCDVELLAPD